MSDRHQTKAAQVVAYLRDLEATASKWDSILDKRFGLAISMAKHSSLVQTVSVSIYFDVMIEAMRVMVDMADQKKPDLGGLRHYIKTIEEGGSGKV